MNLTIYEFEPIIIAPIDLDAINVELMKEDEKDT